MDISFLTALVGAILLGYLAQSTGIFMVRGVAEWRKGAKTPSVSSCRLDRHPAMSAFGQKMCERWWRSGDLSLADYAWFGPLEPLSGS